MAETYTVERTRLVEAPAGVVYAALTDFARWRDWSPWEGLDPTMERAYSGPDVGPGAVMAWSGNRKAGSGRMEILHARHPYHVEIALDFERPFRSRNTTTFDLEEQGRRTLVTWRVTGPRPAALKLLGRFLDMDKLVGGDLEKGLARLAAVTEQRA